MKEGGEGQTRQEEDEGKLRRPEKDVEGLIKIGGGWKGWIKP